jgi:hypothetical protein
MTGRDETGTLGTPLNTPPFWEAGMSSENSIATASIERDHPWIAGVRVSSTGVVFRDGVPLKTHAHSNGYVKACVRRSVHKFVHHLVLETFVGARPAGHQCRHLDGDRRNNRLENLAWGTRQENAQDKIRHGTATIGERNGGAKLTESQAREILSLSQHGYSRRQLSEIYGVTAAAVSMLIHGVTWKHLRIQGSTFR